MIFFKRTSTTSQHSNIKHKQYNIHHTFKHIRSTLLIIDQNINTKLISQFYTSLIYSDIKNTRYTLFGSSHRIQHHLPYIDYISTNNSFFKIRSFSRERAQQHKPSFQNRIATVFIKHWIIQGLPWYWKHPGNTYIKVK